jgi:hypothetical protein
MEVDPNAFKDQRGRKEISPILVGMSDDERYFTITIPIPDAEGVARGRPPESGDDLRPRVIAKTPWKGIPTLALIPWRKDVRIHITVTSCDGPMESPRYRRDRGGNVTR